MAIKFNVQEIGNPQDAAAPKKFYARPVSSGEITRRSGFRHFPCFVHQRGGCYGCFIQLSAGNPA